jgi:hypothetical protein
LVVVTAPQAVIARNTLLGKGHTNATL